MSVNNMLNNEIALKRRTLFWCALWLTTVSLGAGTLGARHYLNASHMNQIAAINAAHARQLAANDAACLKSVLEASAKAKIVPKPKLVREGHTRKSK